MQSIFLGSLMFHFDVIWIKVQPKSSHANINGCDPKASRETTNCFCDLSLLHTLYESMVGKILDTIYF